MTSSPTPSDKQNTYLIDTESATEMARLLEQDRLMTEAMGGYSARTPQRPVFYA